MKANTAKRLFARRLQKLKLPQVTVCRKTVKGGRRAGAAEASVLRKTAKRECCQNDRVREDCEEQTLLRAIVCKRTVKSESCLGGRVRDGDEERVLPKSDRVRESCAERELPRVTVREDCGADTAKSNLVQEDSEEASAAKGDCVQDCKKAKAAISDGLREACEGVRKTAKKSKAATSDRV